MREKTQPVKSRIPSGLKPLFFKAFCGTVETVPLQDLKMDFE